MNKIVKQKEEEEHISKLSMLRILSSTGTMVTMLNHQLRSIVDGIRGVHTDLKESLKKLDDEIRAINKLHAFT